MSETSAPDPTLLAKLAAGDPDACLQVIDRLEHEQRLHAASPEVLRDALRAARRL